MGRDAKIFFLFVFLTIFIILACIPSTFCAPSAPVVYVAGDGSGDFNCDGIDDHLEINQALQFVTENPGYTTVHLKGPFTYTIADTIQISSNTVLEGDSSATIKLVSNARWKAAKPMIKENSSGTHDITIRGFTIDGNREENTNVHSGANYYNIFGFTDTQNIDINHMTLTNNHDDGVETNNCTNIKYHDNTLYSLGHDGLYAIYSSNIEAYNNNISCRINSGLRAYNSNHVSFHDNTITTVTTERSGGAGIEIEKEDVDTPMDDIEVYNNVIYQTMLAGIWIFGSDNYSASSTHVHVHHNRIYDTGLDLDNKATGGIVSAGFNVLIENNVIDGAYGTGIMQNDVYRAGNPESSGLVVTVKNNIITNTCRSKAGGNGSGICNLLTGTHSFILQNNCFCNNTGGNYANIEGSPSDITLDPLYADRDNHDYHLKSQAGRWDGNSWVIDNLSSPCIDAGDPSSDYSNEPEPNGKRINIGPDGNTKYSSKSGVYVPSSNTDTSTDSSSGGSGHSSGGSGGAGGSPELQSNVETKEISQALISSGNTVKFDFPQNATAVVYLSFDAKKTAGKTTTLVEMLKNKSTLVSGLPSDTVYKFLNIWVGNGGYGDSKNIENAFVCFKVEKSWIRDKNIDKSSISLNRYNDIKWNALPANLSGEDDRYLYFKAKTPGFSPFAITGKVTAIGTEIQPTNGNKTQTEHNNVSAASNAELKLNQTKIQGKGKSSIPGFETIFGVISLLAVFLCKRK